MIGVVASLVLGLTFTPVGTDVAVGLRDAVCRILGGTCDSGSGSGSGGDTALPGPGPSGHTTPGPDGDGGTPKFDDASFEPDRCILATETDKERTVMRILFIKLTSSSELKVTQWSDGSVTLDSMGTVQGGVEGGIDFPGLKSWGGGGKTETEVHTEVAELDLKDLKDPKDPKDPKDSETVENYLRNGEDGDDSGIKQIHNAGIPSPHSASEPLAPDATPFERLLHDKVKLSSLDYKVNIDWWKAGFALSLGTSLHKWSTGFKLFGLETSHEHEEQRLVGDPTYAGPPRGRHAPLAPLHEAQLGHPGLILANADNTTVCRMK